MPRDELADVLWGDAPPATWDKALSVLVSKLRALLAEIGLDGARALTAAYGCYRLQLPEGTWVDVLAAESAANAKAYEASMANYHQNVTQYQADRKAEQDAYAAAQAAYQAKLKAAEEKRQAELAAWQACKKGDKSKCAPH